MKNEIKLSKIENFRGVDHRDSPLKIRRCRTQIFQRMLNQKGDVAGRLLRRLRFRTEDI